MRWAAVLVLTAGLAEAQWTPPTPTPTRRPLYTATPIPRPTATPVPPSTPTPTPRPTAPTGGTPCPTCPVDRREFWLMPGMEVLATEPGQPLRLKDGTEFVIFVRHASQGDVPFRLVRIR